MRVLRVDELPFSRIAREFIGADHGDVGVCVIFVAAQPGDGPSLHKHPYEELFIVEEGSARFVVGEEEIDAEAGQILVVPPNTPHKFTATGEATLRQVDIHVSPSFSTEWLE